MKIWERYAEYAIIGGLFWAGMLLIMINNGMAQYVIDHFPELKIPNSGWSGDLSSNALSAIGVIVIFSTGLLIDAISPSIFSLLEIYLFREYINRNNYDAVYEFIAQSSSPTTQAHLNKIAKSSIFFTRYHNWVTTKYYYSSVIAKITAYCLEKADSGLLEEIKDRLNLWRTGRALGAAVGLIGLMMTLSLIDGSLAPQSSSTGLLIIANGVLWLLSFLLVIGQYGRMLHTLFSAIEVLRLLPKTPHQVTSPQDDIS